MVTGGIALTLFPFQEQAVLKLIDLTTAAANPVIVMKAPTGSGKTVILLDYIDEYLFNARPDTAFVWFCPGSGNLEEQSRDKMRRLLPNRRTQTCSRLCRMALKLKLQRSSTGSLFETRTRTSLFVTGKGKTCSTV